MNDPYCGQDLRCWTGIIWRKTRLVRAIEYTYVYVIVVVDPTAKPSAAKPYHRRQSHAKPAQLLAFGAACSPSEENEGRERGAHVMYAAVYCHRSYGTIIRVSFSLWFVAAVALAGILGGRSIAGGDG